MASPSADQNPDPKPRITPVWVVEDSAYEALKAELWLETCEAFEKSGVHLPPSFYSRFPVAWRGYAVIPRTVYRSDRRFRQGTVVLNPAWKKPPGWTLDKDEGNKGS